MEYRKGSHSIYDLKYHVVFCTKYRFRILTGQVATRARELVREVCAANYIDIVSGSMSPDHMHLLLSIPPSISVSKALQYIKGKTGRKLLQELIKYSNNMTIQIPVSTGKNTASLYKRMGFKEMGNIWRYN